ncbi:MAG: hypothetical protein CMJ46_13385 [Planctomyces sp.]|nr:hypothetical protein [Planctomyces sp.]
MKKDFELDCNSLAGLYINETESQLQEIASQVLLFLSAEPARLPGNDFPPAFVTFFQCYRSTL